ncbi:MAG: hypothetical protein KAI47_04405 [Deltaproteobacteria bacterium]|nr:hypothetical protein [Deltaproteobacteria bacterium]
MGQRSERQSTHAKEVALTDFRGGAILDDIMRIRFIVSLVFLFGALPTSASATVMLRLSLDALVGRADRVVVGTVTAKRSAYNSRGRIYTDATIRVEKTVRGQATQTITIRTAGGVVGHIGMRVVGAPSLAVGERVLAFTERRGNARYIVGMRQGLFRIQKNSAGQAIVRRSLSGLSFAKTRPGIVAPPQTIKTRLDEVIALDHFVSQIRQTAARCATRADHCLPANLRAR